MHWRIKSLVQTLMAKLPASLSEPLYFRLQRHFGNLQRANVDPRSRLLFGMEFCRQIILHGHSPIGASFLEIGTGWRLNLPIACWLCGAASIVTVDLNRYLRFPLIQEDLRYLRLHKDQVLSQLRSEYGDLLDIERWHKLMEHRPTSLTDLSSLCGIDYQAPADARHVACETNSIDFHVSCNVFEHIPRNDLHGILQEASRILKPTGLLLHRVDHTDHFSHADRSLSPIHFLQYDDRQWGRYAGHRYAYVNRLREDDYLRLFQECEYDVRVALSQPDAGVAELLEQGFPLNERFGGKTIDTLARLTSLFVLGPKFASEVSCNAA